MEAHRWCVGWISVIGVEPLLYGGRGVGLSQLPMVARAEAPQAGPGVQVCHQVVYPSAPFVGVVGVAGGWDRHHESDTRACFRPEMPWDRVVEMVEAVCGGQVTWCLGRQRYIGSEVQAVMLKEGWVALVDQKVQVMGKGAAISP